MVADVIGKSRSLFIRRWGEMAAYWGISRTMAEIHVLLYAATKPLCTDDVMEQLQISRGNASMNLRALVEWGLISRVHIRGDRKEYFACETDVWQMFQIITLQRKRREFEPIVETIERCKAMVAQELERIDPQEADEIRQYHERLEDMLEFLYTMSALFDQVQRLGKKGMSRLLTILKATTRTK